MSNNPLCQLIKHGQSFWYDNIQRKMLNNGELQKMIDEDGLRGITSNPSIFEKAIANSSDYDASLLNFVKKNQGSARDAFFTLAIEDIQQAADMLKDVYDKSEGLDGYVSLEVSPDLAYDTERSIKEGRELFTRVGRPNAMIKIPSTKEGIPVIEQLIADGINVNATLLFSVDRYVEVANAYIRGLNARHARGLPIHNVASVASFFVSRVDTILDKALDELQQDTSHLKGKMGIANAKLAYIESLELYQSDIFKTLTAAGAKQQRLLWASTGVKNPDYSDVLYIDNLIGPNTVNTIPPATADAFRDHGTVGDTLAEELENAKKEFAEMQSLGIDIPAYMDKLEVDGVAIFEKSFENLIGAIDKKMQQLSDSNRGVA